MSIRFEKVSGPGGTGYYLGDHRVGGSKPWGGGEVTLSLNLNAKDIVAALAFCKEGRAALDSWAEKAFSKETPQ